jgi:hypothetical protein
LAIIFVNTVFYFSSQHIPNQKNKIPTMLFVPLFRVSMLLLLLVVVVLVLELPCCHGHADNNNYNHQNDSNSSISPSMLRGFRRHLQLLSGGLTLPSIPFSPGSFVVSSGEGPPVVGMAVVSSVATGTGTTTDTENGTGMGEGGTEISATVTNADGTSSTTDGSTLSFNGGEIAIAQIDGTPPEGPVTEEITLSSSSDYSIFPFTDGYGALPLTNNVVGGSLSAAP